MCACGLSCFSPIRLFVTLWTVAYQAPLSRIFSRQEYWSGLPCPPPGVIPYLGIKLASLCLLHWHLGSLLQAQPGSPRETVKLCSSVQSLSPVQLFATPWTAACQASLSITNSWSSLKLISIESVMPSNCHASVCSSVLCLVTTKIWSDGH